MTLTNIIRLFLPLIIGFSVSPMCKITSNYSFPPPIAFSIAWTLLYLLIGIAWINSTSNGNDLYFLTLIFVLNLWVYVYGCQNQKENSVYVILLSMLVTLSGILYFNNKETIVSLLLTPLFIWLILATYLNIREVDNDL